VLLKDIAQRQQIPLSYLEHLIVPLVQVAIPGEVTQRPESLIAPVDCVNNLKTCHRSAPYVPRAIWDEIKEVISKASGSVPLRTWSATSE